MHTNSLILKSTSHVKANSVRNENSVESSGILKDADIATEQASLVKATIKQQFGVSMLQQIKTLSKESVQSLLAS